MKYQPPTRPNTTTGTLTRNTDPHQKCCSSQPPAMGPTAMPMPETPAQMPMALARSLGSVKVLVRIERVAGMMMAPPTPMSDRVAMSCDAEPAKADNTEPVPKIMSPMLSAFLRPKRSPRLPAVSSSPANTKV